MNLSTKIFDVILLIGLVAAEPPAPVDVAELFSLAAPGLDSDHAIFMGPGLAGDGFEQNDNRNAFERALDKSPSIPRDFAEFLLTFVPSELSDPLPQLETSQLISLLERTNYELLRTVEDLKKARVLNQLKIWILGSVRLHGDQLKGLCAQWTDSRRLCRYIGALSAYYLWVHLCGALQYAPMINWACGTWPLHLFEDIYTYERQRNLPDDVSGFFMMQ